MEKYQLYIIAERTNRIKNNEQTMKDLKKEIQKIKPGYNMIMSQLIFLAKEYNQIKNDLELLEQDNNKYKNKEELYCKSDRIQNLSELIEQKEQQIQFTDILRSIDYNKKSVVSKLTAFNKFKKYKKQIFAADNEKISLLEIIYQFLNQYRVFKYNEKLSTTKLVIGELLFKYEFERRDMVEEIEQLKRDLEERREFLINYSETKLTLQKRLKEIINTTRVLATSQDYVEYKEKTQKFSDLVTQNQFYQAQINNITEMSKIARIKQYEKCA